jgi:RHS repeat-associated protein
LVSAWLLAACLGSPSGVDEQPHLVSQGLALGLDGGIDGGGGTPDGGEPGFELGSPEPDEPPTAGTVGVLPELVRPASGSASSTRPSDKEADGQRGATGTTDAPPFRLELKTCDNPAPPREQGELLHFALQAGGRVAQWPLNNEGRDRGRRSQRDIYYFDWPTGVVGRPDQIEHIKLDHRGEPWCFDEARLIWRNPASGTDSVLWSWNETVQQQPGTYLQGHALTGGITLDETSASPGLSYVRFTLPNRTITSMPQRCSWSGKEFFFQTCNTSDAPTNDLVTVDIAHDGLVDQIELPRVNLDSPGEHVEVRRDSWCDIRVLEKVTLYKRPAARNWALCDGGYINSGEILSLPGHQYIVYWRLPVDQRRVLGNSPLVFQVNREVDRCTGPGCVTARQGFGLAINERGAKCAAGTNPPDNDCDNVDDDCDGEVDEHYVPATCGVGICRSASSCVNGAVRACQPSSPRPAEISSNGLDDDCDGSVDEAAPEYCTDNADNDRDSLVDCQDSDCEAHNQCRGNPGAVCGEDRDCDRGLVCVDGQCRAAHCENGILDGQEASRDCGGPDCRPCDGRSCDDACRVGERITPRAVDLLQFQRGTFTRAAESTFELTPGRIETARANELRWVYVNGQRMALLEGSALNVVRSSSAFDRASDWTTAPTTPMTVVADAAASPDGTRTAEVLRSPTGPARGPTQMAMVTSGPWSLSLHVRTATEDYGDVGQTRFFITDTNGAVMASKTQQVFDRWTRVDLPVTAAATAALSHGISHAAGWPTAATSELRAPELAIWGAQLENRPFPTSYIPTTSSITTRPADVLVIEGNAVPSWLGRGLWQVDVRPEFSSAELIPSWRHTLFSYDATNDIALVASSNHGRARLSIKHGTRTYLSQDLRWARGDVLRFTFNMALPAPGQADRRGVTIEGAASGNGTYAVPILSHPQGTRLRVGGALNGSGEAFAAISEPRALEGTEEICELDASCSCGNGVIDSGEACDPVIGACNRDCTEAIHVICVSDADCPTGQQCADIGDRIGQDSSRRYCWPVDPCATHPASACGSADAACGECVCQPDCSQAVCGASNDNGCGGVCADVCDNWGGGCEWDVECGTGFSCGIGQGEFLGHAPATNVCWPEYCDHPRERLKHCGSASAPCGECPPAGDDCGSRECGTDSRGNSCGTCPSGLRCEAGGYCRDNFDEPVANDVGTLPASFAVDESGAANYTVPIEVPPGRAGVTPRLALAYRSSSGHGYAGRGWSLTGLSAIGRCARTFAQDGFSRGVQNSAFDAFCLDGKRLVAIRGPYGEDGTEYRTELDSFQRVISRGNPLRSGAYVGPQYFEVYDKSGYKHTYGQTEDARVTADLRNQGGSGATTVNIAWMVQRTEDTYGNRMRVQYERHFVIDEAMSSFPDGAKIILRHVAEIQPRAILYGDDDSHVVRIAYKEDMVNAGVRSYRGGVSRHVSAPIERISTAIQTDHGMEQVRSYEFSTHFAGDGWLLDSVMGCAGAGAARRCIPATEFDYPEARANMIVEAESDEVGSIPIVPRYNRKQHFEPWNFNNFDIFTFDHDGDGRQDLLHSKFEGEGDHDDDSRLYLRRSRGALRDFKAFHAPGQELGDRCHAVLAVLDFNDDGRDDIIARCFTHSNEFYEESRLLLSTGDGFTSRPLQQLVDGDTPLPIDEFLKLGRLLVSDLDGDGRPDLLRVNKHDDDTTSVVVYRNTGERFRQLFTASLPDRDTQCTSYDWDGDGTAEVLCQYDDFFDGANDGSKDFRRLRVLGLEGEALVGRADLDLNGLNVALALKIDANADGITDLIFEDSANTADEHVAQLYLGTGRGYKYATRTPAPLGVGAYPPGKFTRVANNWSALSLFIYDVDGDGRQELLEGNWSTGKWDVHRPYVYRPDAGVAWVKDAAHSGLPYYAPAPRDELPQNGYAHPTVLDWDGDGIKEVLQRVPGPDDEDGPAYKHPLFQLWKPTPPTQHLLSSVTDGFGKVVTIGYAVKPRDYEAGDDCRYPQRCLKTLPTPVVEWHSVTGDGGFYRDPRQPAQTQIQRSFAYSYEDARVDVRGRGWLGFRKRVVKEFASATSLLSETTIHYDLEAESAVLKLYYGAGRPSRTVVRTITSEPSLNGPGPSVHHHVSSQELELKWPSDGRPFIVPRSARTETELASDGGLLTTRRDDSFQYDDFGNTTSAVTRWSDGRTQSVTTTYETRSSDGTSLVDRWLVGLPREISVLGMAHQDELELVPRGHKLRFAYNIHGLVERLEKRSWAGGTEVSTVFGYDDFGNVESRTIVPRDGEERTDLIHYEPNGIHPDYVTNTAYEDAEVPRTSLDFDARTGALRYSRSPDGTWSLRSHDAFGRLRSTESDTGVQTTIDYRRGGAGGGVLTVATHGSAQPTTETEYNAFGQVIRRFSRHWGGTGNTVARSSVQELGYDELGRLKAMAVPHAPGETVHFHGYEYDALGRLTRELALWQDAEGAVAHVPITHMYGHRPLVPDPRGVRWSDVPGAVTAHSVESPTQPKTVTLFNQRGATVGVTDARGTLTTYDLGAFDEVHSATTLHSTTTFVLDTFGRVTDVLDPNSGHHAYSFNGLDLVRTYERNMGSPEGHRSIYHYDFLGRMDQASTPDGAYAWDYDGDLSDPTQIGRLTRESVVSATVGNSETRYVYGGPGGAITETHRMIDGETFDSYIEYDGLGRLELLRYPVSERPFALRYQYDGNHGRIQAVYDATDATRPLWKLEDVDAFGNASQVRLGNGLVTHRTYEAATGRLSQTLTRGASGQISHSEQIVYDSRGLPRQIESLNGHILEQYDHDEVGRLSNRTRIAELGGFSEEFWYSSDGNLILRSAIGGINYADPEHPHRVTSTEDGQVYGYDDHGRQDWREGEHTAGGVQRIEYSSFDLPLTVATGGPDSPNVNRYRYDANNKRVVREDPDGSRTLYVGEVYERTTQGDGTLKHRLAVPTPDGPSIEVSIEGDVANYRFQATDRLGSPATVTDSDGRIRGIFTHHPFGAPEIAATDDPDARPRFTGHEHDSTQLINMRGRIYDPVIGRFLTPDPIVQNPSFSQSWNRYSYVWNSPLALTDPSGFEAKYDVTAQPGQTTIVVTDTYLSSYNSLLSDPGPTVNSLPADPLIQELANGVARGVGRTAGVILGLHEAIARVGRSIIPGAGEYDDVQVLQDEEASVWEKRLAAGSLILSILSVGGAPNFGSARAAWRDAGGAGNLSKAARGAPAGFGQGTVGAARKITGEVLQTGGNTIQKRTANALNETLGESLKPREWGRALEGMKKELDLANNHHGKILSNGDYMDSAGNYLGNLLDYL